MPPVTPSNDIVPDFPDNVTEDTQSVLSSTMSELSTNQLESTMVEESMTVTKEGEVTKTVEEQIAMPELENIQKVCDKFYQYYCIIDIPGEKTDIY